jgi:hypothetical protein
MTYSCVYVPSVEGEYKVMYYLKSYFLLICDKKACVDCSMAMSSYKYLYLGGEQL